MVKTKINLKYDNRSENRFTLKIDNNPKNVFVINNVSNEKNSVFLNENWVIILIDGYSNEDLKLAQNIINIVDQHPNLFFAIKAYADKSKINEFSNKIKEVKVTPVLLFKKGSETKFLPSRVFDIVELDVLLGNFDFELKRKVRKTCYSCKAFVDHENKCLKCSKKFKEVKPKCITDARKTSSIEDIKDFIKVSDEHFFEFDNYNTLVFGENIIEELLKMLQDTTDDDYIEYNIFLGLRMCDVEIWSTTSDEFRYKYRLPNKDVFYKI